MQNELEQVNDSISKLVERYVEEVINRTKMKTPVDTGKLRDSWIGTSQETQCIFENSQPYAGFVEYGTVKMAPVGMLTTTLNESEQILQSLTNEVGLNK
jgi:hypothetical protein